MSAEDHFFAERRVREELSLRRGALEHVHSAESGVALERWSPEAVQVEWTSLPSPTAVLPASVERAWAQVSADRIAPLERESLEPLESRLRGWASRAQVRGIELDVLLRSHSQHIAAGALGAARFDRRQWTQLELKARVDGGAAQKWSLRELTFASIAALDENRIDEALEELLERTLLKRSEVPAPPGPMTIVLPAGADAGVLFHEMCGHPLEGDVVVRRASCLAERLSGTVAPEFLSVVDTALAGPGTVQFEVDDEGEPAREVSLIASGRVADPLVNRRTATALGRPSNGHGRRTSYRDAALPRMAHTAVKPHRGSADEIVGAVANGLWVSFLTPRSVHLMSGDFTFHIAEARLIRDGRLGAFVGPALLEGNILRTLAGIEAVGGDSASFFGLKGCGKLDQGGLPVSFGNPTLRLSSLSVRPLS